MASSCAFFTLSTIGCIHSNILSARTQSADLVDLDYFNEVDSLSECLRELLHWGGRPVSVVVEEHHNAFGKWRYLVRQGQLSTPHFIIHVDEHHDKTAA